MGHVNSPCINICKLDADQICIGCYRTIDEISNWVKYSEQEKCAVIDKSEERKWQKLEKEL